MAAALSSMPGRESAVDRIAVDITFLRMDQPPAQAVPSLPDGCLLSYVPAPSVAFYRYLYHTVGRDYCWWLRRIEPDERLACMLARESVLVFVLYRHGEPAGFFELELRAGPDCNISYFGLMPHAIGQRLGAVFLDVAVAAAWSLKPRGVTVNTCTADHPRALPAYRRAGFIRLRTVREVWEIPRYLNLPIPAHLRI